MEEQERAKTLRYEFVTRYRREPELWIRAPGQLDLMGSYTDLHQGYALTVPIQLDAWMTVGRRRDASVDIRSLNVIGSSRFALRRITRDAEHPWSDYARGVAAVLWAEGYRLPGMNCVIDTRLPMGGGLGSSAAMETAVARALQVLGRLQIDPIQMAILCQRAEIEFVGADCSIAEPFTALLGQAGCALCIDCRDLSSRQAPIPRDISVVLCDTRSQQQMPQALHRAIEADCQAGVSLITQRFPDIRSLRDVTQDQLRAVAAELSPAAVRRCRFLVEENGRALALTEALARGDRSAIRQAMLASYSGAHDDLGITTDEMEQMMYAVLSSPGVIGARHTGRGFGGCVVALVDADEADLFVTDVARRYWSLTHIRAKITQVQVVDGAGLIEQQSVRR